MELEPNNQMLMRWLSLTHMQMKITNELECILQEKHQLSLKEFYVLLFLSEAPGKKLKLLQLQHMVGLSQSAMSRLVSRFEEKGCGALKRHICTEDRRAVYTSITQLGEEKLTHASLTLNEALTNVFSKKTIQAELEQFIQPFHK